MTKLLSTLALLAAVAASPSLSATVASGTTKIGDTNNITLADSGTAQATTPPSGVATIPDADWVWGAGGVGSSATFEFIFDLTGFNPLSVSLTGSVAVDNFVTISLNGTQIFALTGLLTSHFQTVNTFGTSDVGLFNAGTNTLTFLAQDSAGLRGMTAEVSVTAAPVPLPAGLPLLAGGLGAVALLRRTARRS